MEDTSYERTRAGEGGSDLFSKLPDALLPAITSFLPLKESVRTSVLAQRWRHVWKFTSHLDFDQRGMFIDLDSRRILQLFGPNWPAAIKQTARLINSVLNSHRGSLRSCSIRHMIESCYNGDALVWMRKLVEKKGVQELSMECEICESWRPENPAETAHALTLELPFELLSSFQVLQLTHYVLDILPPFEGSQKLKTLKLKKVSLKHETIEEILSRCLCLEALVLRKCSIVTNNLKIQSPSIKYLEVRKLMVDEIKVSAVELEIIEFDTVFSDPKKLKINAPNLKVFHCYYNPKLGRISTEGFGSPLLTTRLLFETCSGLLGSGGSGHGNIFRNLITLFIDLDLNNLRDIIPFSFVLRSCPFLHSLKVHNKVMEDVKFEDDSEEYNEYQKSLLAYSKSLFWEKRRFCECISCTLQTVCITEYKGTMLEREFVKYLIKEGRVMETITLWIADARRWEGATGKVSLPSIERASPNLSITLKPGKRYMAKDYGWRIVARGSQL